MAQRTALLDCKLAEMEKQYGLLYARTAAAQRQDAHQVRQTLRRLEEEMAKSDAMLAHSVARSHSPAVRALSEAQLHYCREMKRLSATLEEQMHGGAQGKAEAAALYAEYALDFATQSARFALAAALRAIEVQKRMEETETENERTKETEEPHE